MIKEGNIVSVHYTGKLTTGEIFDSSTGKDPLVFTIGSGQLIPGFENGVIGRNIGDKIEITIDPADGYGDVREDLYVKVPNDQLPGVVSVGQILQATAPNGTALNVTVKEVNEDHVIIDGNHPFAGRSLVFDIEILDVK